VVPVLTRLLLSNDDGCQAPGLRALAAALREAYTLDVVAPDRNRSGASNSLTLSNPLRAQQHEDGVWCVDGTPTDCVHLALTGLLPEKPALVVSGINAGANLGDDVLYSGTVAAAMEGRFLGKPAIAISNVSLSPKHFETAARIAVLLVGRLAVEPLPGDTILNVNVPDVPYEDLTGIVSTRLGKRHLAEKTVRDRDPRGRTIYWVGAAGPEADCGPGTDFHAVSNNAVSVTPILTDLTRYSELDRTRRWVEGLR
jgi:5'-nucleotidase